MFSTTILGQLGQSAHALHPQKSGPEGVVRRRARRLEGRLDLEDRHARVAVDDPVEAFAMGIAAQRVRFVPSLFAQYLPHLVGRRSVDDGRDGPTEEVVNTTGN